MFVALWLTLCVCSLLLSNKSTKRLLRMGATLFNQKPVKGIMFLQSNGVLPPETEASPLPPDHLAVFLRTALSVGLDKSAIGMYLGAAGSAQHKDVCETASFHKDLLLAYTRLFHFDGQPLLSSLRMFLAAFRLPGEAQQIDRIIEAFSMACVDCEEAEFSRANEGSDEQVRRA